MLKNKLSVIILTKNNQDVLEEALKSIKLLHCNIIIVDSNSSDKTLKIAKNFTKNIYTYSDVNLGRKRQFSIKQTNSEWILFLDADERVSVKLSKEIKKILNKKNPKSAYAIPFHNHLFNKRIKYGGENYKMIRLIKKNSIRITHSRVHEKILSKSSNIGNLNNPIYHYSYRNIIQIFLKFTDYAIRDAKDKSDRNVRTSIRKIFLYPAHMFWARFIKDKGYKDGFPRIFLDLGFAYMEFLTYILIPFFKVFK